MGQPPFQATGLSLKKIHEEIEIKTFKCKECGKVYNYQKLLRHHIENSHKRYYSCEKCDKAYNNFPQLKLHIQHVHDNKVHKCPHCDKFYNQLRLKQHIKNVHKGHKCDSCDRHFKAYIALYAFVSE